LAIKRPCLIGVPGGLAYKALLKTVIVALFWNVTELKLEFTVTPYSPSWRVGASG
jgi:hypothetical protein